MAALEQFDKGYTTASKAQRAGGTHTGMFSVIWKLKCRQTS